MNPPSKKPGDRPSPAAGGVVTASPAPLSLSGPNKPCETLITNSDGSVEFSVIVPADIVRRLRNRAHTQALEDYVWENVFKPGLNSHVY